MNTFRLHNPESLDQAIALLDAPETKLLAGGQDLLTELKEHLVEPANLVNLKSIRGLDQIAFDGAGSLSIGALATIATLAEHAQIGARVPLLAQAALSIGSPQIRSIGTLGGNLCQRPRCWYYRNENARCLKKGGTKCFSYGGLNKYNAILGGGPSYIVHPSDLAPALVALGAEVELMGKRGKRTLPLEKFFTLPADGSVLRENVLTSDEVLVRVTIAAPASGMRSTYLKFKERESFDFALSAVAACLWIEGGKIRALRLVLGGVAPIPWRSESAEKIALGQPANSESFATIAAEALREAEPMEHNGYKVPLTKALIVRALSQLAKA